MWSKGKAWLLLDLTLWGHQLKATVAYSLEILLPCANPSLELLSASTPVLLLPLIVPTFKAAHLLEKALPEFGSSHRQVCNCIPIFRNSFPYFVQYLTQELSASLVICFSTSALGSSTHPPVCLPRWVRDRQRWSHLPGRIAACLTEHIGICRCRTTAVTPDAAPVPKTWDIDMTFPLHI